MNQKDWTHEEKRAFEWAEALCPASIRSHDDSDLRRVKVLLHLIKKLVK